MDLSLTHAERLLERTPAVLEAWLRGLPDDLLRACRGAGSWSPFDIVAHLVHGEQEDWIPRARLLLEHGPELPFEPFDREGHRAVGAGKTLDDLLEACWRLRAENLRALRELDLGPDDLSRPGRHPELGAVTLGQLLCTWAVHDQSHIAQIARTLAHQGREAVGPWRAYLPVLG